MLDKTTETAYNLWAKHVDRPSEWWFSGSIRYRPPGWARGAPPLVASPDQLCAMGHAQFVFDMVERAVVQMEKVW